LVKRRCQMLRRRKTWRIRLAKPCVPRVHVEPSGARHSRNEMDATLVALSRAARWNSFPHLPMPLVSVRTIPWQAGTKGRAQNKACGQRRRFAPNAASWLVRDVLHVWKSCDSKVLRSEVLLQCQAIAKLALAGKQRRSSPRGKVLRLK